MGYRDSGFWVRDYQAEIWLYLMAQQAREIPDVPAWLATAADNWHLQATAGFTGCVSSCLDEHLGFDSARVAVTLELSEQALQRLVAWSPAIPKRIVNPFGTGGQAESFAMDLPTGPLRACGRSFVRLLRGEFPPGHHGWAR